MATRSGSVKKSGKDDKKNGHGDGGGDGDDGDDTPAMFFRATYAAAPYERILEGIKRFGEAVKEEFGFLEERSEGNEENGEVKDSGSKKLADEIVNKEIEDERRKAEGEKERMEEEEKEGGVEEAATGISGIDGV